MAHLALDTLQRYGNHDKSLDENLLVLACVSIAAKNCSVHGAGHTAIAKFYYSQNLEGLQLPKFAKVQKRIEEELKRCELEVLRVVRFNFTSLEQLPLTKLRDFVKDATLLRVATGCLADLYCQKFDCRPVMMAAHALDKAHHIIMRTKDQPAILGEEWPEDLHPGLADFKSEI